MPWWFPCVISSPVIGRAYVDHGWCRIGVRPADVLLIPVALPLPSLTEAHVVNAAWSPREILVTHERCRPGAVRARLRHLAAARRPDDVGRRASARCTSRRCIPRAVRGVMQNSDFRKDAWGRLLRTADFVGTITLRHHRGRREGGRAGAADPPRLTATDPPPASGTASTNRTCCCGCTAPRSTPTSTSSAAPASPSATPRPTATSTNTASAHASSASTPRPCPPRPAELAEYFAYDPPLLVAGPEARDVDDFLRRPPAPIPARARRGNCCGGAWRNLAYDSLPPYAHELYGRSVRPPARSPGSCAPPGTVLRCVPARLRWQLPAGTHPESNGPARPRHPPRPVQSRTDRSPYWTGQGRAQQSNGGDRSDGGNQADPGPVPVARPDRARRHGRGVACPGRVAGQAGRREVPQAAGPAPRQLGSPVSCGSGSAARRGWPRPSSTAG